MNQSVSNLVHLYYDVGIHLGNPNDCVVKMWGGSMETTKIFDVLNALDTPLLVVEQGGRIEWANQAAKVTVCTHLEFDSWDGENTLPQGYS